MKSGTAVAVLLASQLVSACATTYYVSPVVNAGQEVRYEQGTPTTFSAMPHGSLEVTALGLDDDRRIVFGIAAFNETGTPSNFGIENLALENGQHQTIRIYTADELIAEAKRKAEWKEFGTLLAVGLVATAAALPTRTNGYVSSPYGTTTFSATTYNPSQAAANAAAIGQAGAWDISQIQGALDATISNVRGHVLQTTTVDPGNSYGGEAVSTTINSDLPQNAALTIRWNGDEHIFNFVLTQDDQPRPAVVTATTASASAEFRPQPIAEVASTHVTPALRSPSAKPSFGVDGSELTRANTLAISMRDPRGVVVESVQPASVAARAGIQEGDVILRVDGLRIVTIDNLNDAVARVSSGKISKIWIWRDDRELTVDARF